MPKLEKKSAPRVMAWWLGGEEYCPHCGQVYAYELEFRCPDCDGPCCAHCKKQHEDVRHGDARHGDARHVCPECFDCKEV